jgi:hypothetical protein
MLGAAGCRENNLRRVVKKRCQKMASRRRARRRARRLRNNPPTLSVVRTRIPLSTSQARRRSELTL